MSNSNIENKAELFARILGAGGTFSEADKAWKASPGYAKQDRTNGVRDSFFALIVEGISKEDAEKWLMSQSTNVQKAVKNWMAIWQLAQNVREASAKPAAKPAARKAAA